MGGEGGVDRVFRLVRRDPLSESARRNSAQEREKHGDHQKPPAGAHGQRIPACRSAVGVKFAQRAVDLCERCTEAGGEPHTALDRTGRRILLPSSLITGFTF